MPKNTDRNTGAAVLVERANGDTDRYPGLGKWDYSSYVPGALSVLGDGNKSVAMYAPGDWAKVWSVSEASDKL